MSHGRSRAARLPATGNAAGAGVSKMDRFFKDIALQVPPHRFANWAEFISGAPEYSIGLEVVDDTPGHRGHHVHFDHHAGVVREATMSAAMQAYIAVRQGRFMERWLKRKRPIPVYVWNADQDVCLACFILEYHELLERKSSPLIRQIVQFNNKIDVCGGLYPDQPRRTGEQPLHLGVSALLPAAYAREDARGRSAHQGHHPGSVRPPAGPSGGPRRHRPHHGQAGNPVRLALQFCHRGREGRPQFPPGAGGAGFHQLHQPGGHAAQREMHVQRDSRLPYDDDVFEVPKLIEAFQAAEDLPGVRLWGGSNMAAGSDSELGSSLHWTQLRDIAEPIVRQAYEASAAPSPACRA